MWSFSIRKTTKGLLFIFLLSLLVCGAAAAQEASDKADPAEEIFMQVFGDAGHVSGPEEEIPEIPVEIFLEGTYVGDVQARIEEGLSLSLERQALLGILEPELYSGRTASLQSALEDGVDAYISLEQLQEFGITASYDPLLLRVSLYIPADLKKPRSLRLRDLPESYRLDMLTADPFSAYLNYYSQAGFLYDPSSGLNETTASFRGRIDPVFQLHRWVLEGGASYDSEGSPQFEFDYLRLIRDFPAAGLRLSAGTVTAAAAGSVSALPILGIGIGTEEALSSLSDHYTPLTREILLEQPAEVSIYLNGRLLKRSRLDAGTHTLVDFPYTGGLNDVRIVITEDDGSERVLSSFVPFDAGLLKPGEISFAVFAGTAREELSEPLVSGFFSYGAHRNATLGLSLQGGAELAVGDFSTILATPLGNLGGNFGMSLPFSGNGEVGYGAQFNYRLTFPSRRTLPSLGVQFEYTGDSFRKHVLDSSTDAYRYRIRSVIGQALPLESFMSLSTTYGLGRDETADSLQVSMTVLKGIEKLGSLSAGFTLTHLTGEVLQWHGTLSFSINPGPEKGRSAMYSQDLRTGQGSATFTWREEERDSFYTAALGTYPPSEYEQTSVDVGAYFNTPRFRGSITNSVFGTSESLGAGDRFSAGLGGSVLFSGGRFALAGPLQDSFVLVVPGPELEGELLSAQNTRGGGSLKEGVGKALVFSEVKSYSPFSLRLELPYTAPDVVLREDTINLLPSYRSGTTVIAGLKKSIFAEGRLLTLDGEPLKLQAGSLVPAGGAGLSDGSASAAGEASAGGEEQILFFTDENGRFQLHDLHPGGYRLTLFAAELAEIDLTVPPNAENPLQLGDLILPVVQR